MPTTPLAPLPVTDLSKACQQRLRQGVEELRLPPQATNSLLPWYAAVANWLRKSLTPGKPLLVSINGAQGSGKSTFCELTSRILDAEFGLNSVSVSLDDFYLGRADRKQLATTIHPLLRTRGVPGTHNLALARQTLAALASPVSYDATPLRIPAFDKARDDPCPQSRWPRVQRPLDIILFEGWCNHAPLVSASELQAPINELEREEDADGRWRHYVNRQLGRYHKQLFDKAELLIHLQVPDFAKVYEWRGLQEQKLRDRIVANPDARQSSRVMDEQALRRFIQHYERITRNCLATLPEQADCVIAIDPDHDIESITLRSKDIKGD